MSETPPSPSDRSSSEQPDLHRRRLDVCRQSGMRRRSRGWWTHARRRRGPRRAHAIGGRPMGRRDSGEQRHDRRRGRRLDLVSEKLEIRKTARIRGSVRARTIAVAQGAVIDGDMAVTSGAPVVHFEEKRKEIDQEPQRTQKRSSIRLRDPQSGRRALARSAILFCGLLRLLRLLLAARQPLIHCVSSATPAVSTCVRAERRHAGCIAAIRSGSRRLSSRRCRVQ